MHSYRTREAEQGVGGKRADEWQRLRLTGYWCPCNLKVFQEGKGLSSENQSTGDGVKQTPKPCINSISISDGEPEASILL